MLNKVINENRVKFEEEKLTLFKEYKSEMNMWKKDLALVRAGHVDKKTKSIFSGKKLPIYREG